MTALTVDEYIETAPSESRERLERMLELVSEEIPGGELVMAYGIPTVKKGKSVVHTCSCRNHIGFYPGAEVMKTFEPRLKAYKRAKGSVQFPLEASLPEALIRDMIRARLAHLS
ncbi:MAG: DUF1801 domain-containing protein [Bacteroidetes bacterium]|nr:DUF1801 domain-containing protein [Bacteroidota bacterium]